jgi:hypothetical protein
LQEHIASIFRDKELAKQDTSKKVSAFCLLHAGFLLGLLSNHEGGMFL